MYLWLFDGRQYDFFHNLISFICRVDKNGSARLFFENGMLLSEATYADGKEEGVAKIYYASGDLLAAVTFEKGKAVAGHCRTRNGENRELDIADLAAFQDNGRLPCTAK